MPAITSPAGLLKILTEFGRDAVNFSSAGIDSTTAPTGTRLVLVEVWGAGGGGGGGTTGNWPFNPSGEPIFGPGGGGGAYACQVIDPVSGGTSISYTVGSGGSGQAQPNEGSSTPRAGSGGTSSITVGATTVSANGGQGAVSWLTESSPGDGYDTFNQEVGSGGSPNGNSGAVGQVGGLGGEGGAALSSSYTVNGLNAWFGSSAAGGGGFGGFGGGSGGGNFSAGSAGSNGFIRVYYIGNVSVNNLTAFYRNGLFVPDASPNTAILTSDNISIASFVGAELLPACGSTSPTPTPPTAPPIAPPPPPPGPTPTPPGTDEP